MDNQTDVSRYEMNDMGCGATCAVVEQGWRKGRLLNFDRAERGLID